MAKKDDELIREAIEFFAETQSAESDNRENAVFDIKFENGENQWTEEEKIARTGRPCPVVNKVAGSVKGILGDARKNRPRIKVRPADSVSDPLTAEIFTGLIRNIENISDAEEAYDTGHDHAVRGAYGYWRIITDYSSDDTFDQDIMIERIVNPQSVYYDQSSIKSDYSDAEKCLVCSELSIDRFDRLYPKANRSSWELGEGEADSGWFTDETVRVADYWYKEYYTKQIFEDYDGRTFEVRGPKKETIQGEGSQAVQVVSGKNSKDEEILDPVPYLRERAVRCHRVMCATISGSEVLVEPKEWPGKYIPIIPCLGEEVWIEGKRILRSAIRHSIDAQKLYNWARANNQETLALGPKQPWLVTPEQIDGLEHYWDTAYYKPMPYLPYNNIAGQPQPQRLSGSIGDHGANQEAMIASDDIKATIGRYDASLGARSNETSGRAISERKEQGDSSTFVFTDNQVRAVKYTGRVLADLIPKIYDTERVVRLLGDDLQKKFGNNPNVEIQSGGKEAWAKINVTDPQTGKIVANDMSIGKYDIVIDAGPGHATRRLEAADGMERMVSAVPQTAPVLIPRIAKSADWPDSDETAEELRSLMQPQPQGPSPKDQMDLQKGQMDIEGKQLDNAKKSQDLQAGQQEQMQIMYKVAQAAVVDILKQIGMVPPHVMP